MTRRPFAALLTVPVLLLAAGLLSGAAPKDRPVVLCPLKPDPPPVIDGDRREWDDLPGAMTIGDANVTWGRPQYRGEEDLSGTVMVCYDANYLYLLADVIDDKIVPTDGKSIFRCDHVELTFAPVYRDGMQGPRPANWRIIGFGPGSVEVTGDPLSDFEPEAAGVYPPNLDTSGIDVGASITEEGYVLEARIPWKVLGVRGPVKPGMVFGIDVHLSDSDNSATQESMTSLNPIPWKGRLQENILKMVLTGTDGKPPR